MCAERGGGGGEGVELHIYGWKYIIFHFWFYLF